MLDWLQYRRIVAETRCPEITIIDFRQSTLTLIDGRLVLALYALLLRFLSPKPSSTTQSRTRRRPALRQIQNWGGRPILVALACIDGLVDEVCEIRGCVERSFGHTAGKRTDSLLSGSELGGLWGRTMPSWPSTRSASSSSRLGPIGRSSPSRSLLNDRHGCSRWGHPPRFAHVDACVFLESSPSRGPQTQSAFQTTQLYTICFTSIYISIYLMCQGHVVLKC